MSRHVTGIKQAIWRAIEQASARKHDWEKKTVKEMEPQTLTVIADDRMTIKEGKGRGEGTHSADYGVVNTG